MPQHIDQPKDIRKGEEFQLDSLTSYLKNQFPEIEGALTVKQFPSGFSNLTYQVQWGENDWVLRRPPFGANVKSGHDMSREYKILSALYGSEVKVPQPILFCEDTEVIGAEFYIMERVKGVILRGYMKQEQLPEKDTMAGIAQSWVNTFAALHNFPIEGTPLAGFGKPEGYVARQVEGWAKRYQKAKTDEIDAMEKVAAWLVENQPKEVAGTLIHNDYKYDNVVLNPTNLTEITAVLDWEMATLGDPLMDLGTSLGYWLEAADPEPLRQLSLSPTISVGNPTREQVVAMYEKASGKTVDNVVFYYAFGLFKIAVIVQQIYYRYKKGYTQDPRFKGLIHGVKGCSMLAMQAIHKKRIGDLF